MLEELGLGIAGNVLYDIGKRYLKDFGTFFGRFKHLFKPRTGAMVFIPQAACLTVKDAAERKVLIRLILHGSTALGKGRPIVMEPDFKVNIVGEVSGDYYFRKTERFSTAALPKGRHAYFLGELPLRPEHAHVDPVKSRPGIMVHGRVHVEGVGWIPIFISSLSAGAVGAGGGFINEPIEQRAITGDQPKS